MQPAIELCHTLCTLWAYLSASAGIRLRAGVCCSTFVFLVASVIMLPTETFAEVVGFLRLADLSALAVTNALCSMLTLEASLGIRWEEFIGLRFYVRKQTIQIYSDFVRDEHGSYHTQLVTYFMPICDINATSKAHSFFFRNLFRFRCPFSN